MKYIDLLPIKKQMLDEIDTRLRYKNAEYAGENDIFDNFNLGARLTGNLSLQVLMSYMAKHICWLYEQQLTPDVVDYEKWYDKTLDVICYLILSIGMIKSEEQGCRG
jgi:hypothetical protein